MTLKTLKTNKNNKIRDKKSSPYNFYLNKEKDHNLVIKTNLLFLFNQFNQLTKKINVLYLMVKI